MAETADVLARPEVQKAIADVITAAGIAYGVKPSHAREIADRFVAPIRAGQPVTLAINIVDVIRKTVVEAMGWNGCLTGDCPHATQAECDKHIADEVRALVDDSVECAACSRAGGADRAVFHKPPVCP